MHIQSAAPSSVKDQFLDDLPMFPFSYISINQSQNKSLASTSMKFAGRKPSKNRDD